MAATENLFLDIFDEKGLATREVFRQSAASILDSFQELSCNNKISHQKQLGKKFVTLAGGCMLEASTLPPVTVSQILYIIQDLEYKQNDLIIGINFKNAGTNMKYTII